MFPPNLIKCFDYKFKITSDGKSHFTFFFIYISYFSDCLDRPIVGHFGEISFNQLKKKKKKKKRRLVSNVNCTLQ